MIVTKNAVPNIALKSANGKHDKAADAPKIKRSYDGSFLNQLIEPQWLSLSLNYSIIGMESSQSN
jgi:hypothetical protein